jgi:hexulose-6-phosphate isomerase
MRNGAVYKKGYSLVVGERDLSSLLPAIAAAGFDGVEPTFVEGALPSPDAEDPNRGARELAARCGDLGLAIPSMRGGRVPWWSIPSPLAKERTAALDHTRRALDALATMGGSVLLIVPGERSRKVDYFAHWQRVLEYGRAAGEIARSYGMRIGLENVEAAFPTSLRDWRDLVDEIADPGVGVYFDVGNVSWLGLGYPEEWLRHLAHRILRLHFKDARFRLAGATLHSEIHQILDGDVDWAEVMTAVREIGYQGWISVEPESYRHARHRLPERLSRDLEAIFQLSSQEETPDA